MLGKMLSVSGGTHVVAQNFIRLLGVKRAPWAILLVALVVGVSVLFSVGLLLLVPVVLAIARETKIPKLKLAIPLAAGLSVSQGLLPPHPGPMLAIEQMGADVGKTILYAALIGLPTAIFAGPLFASFIVPRLKSQPDDYAPAEPVHQLAASPPGFALTLLTLLLPVLLMLLASLADLTLAPDNHAREWVDFIGSPLIAMLSAVLLACYSFGYARGFDGRQISRFLEECVGPAASILLVIGAGGGLSKVLERGDAGTAAARLVGGGFNPRGGRLGNCRHHDGLRDHGARGGQHSGYQPRIARAGHGGWLVVFIACERQRILAGEGKLKPHRAADVENLDGVGNQHRPSGARAGNAVRAICLKAKTH